MGHPYRERYGINQPVAEVPNLHPMFGILFTELDWLAKAHVLRVLSVLLGQPPEWLPKMARDGDSILRVILYEALKKLSFPPGCMRSSPHEDIDLATLIPARRGRGLVLILKDGSKYAIEVEGDDRIICQLGDMFQFLSGHVYPSTTHMVVNPEDENASTVSTPFFIHPPHDFFLEVQRAFWNHPNVVMVPGMSAGRFLYKRLIEIGVYGGENPYPE